MNLRHDELRLDISSSVRESLSSETVEDYAFAYSQGNDLPPLGVIWDGTHHWVWDGRHRWYGSRMAGLTEIECSITEGTKTDAIRLALGANATHGLRRTNADKRACIRLALETPEIAKLTPQEIADICGVARSTVWAVRQKPVVATDHKRRVFNKHDPKKLKQVKKPKLKITDPKYSRFPEHCRPAAASNLVQDMLDYLEHYHQCLTAASDTRLFGKWLRDKALLKQMEVLRDMTRKTLFSRVCMACNGTGRLTKPRRIRDFGCHYCRQTGFWPAGEDARIERWIKCDLAKPKEIRPRRRP